jgi:hypothetical protein
LEEFIQKKQLSCPLVLTWIKECKSDMGETAIRRIVVKEEYLKVATEICTKIEETDRNVAKVQAIVEILGETAVRKILRETIALDQNGGETTNDKSKRRTKGGVFFRLIKDAISKEDMKAISALETNKTKGISKGRNLSNKRGRKKNPKPKAEEEISD